MAEIKSKPSKVLRDTFDDLMKKMNQVDVDPGIFLSSTYAFSQALYEQGGDDSDVRNDLVSDLCANLQGRAADKITYIRSLQEVALDKSDSIRDAIPQPLDHVDEITKQYAINGGFDDSMEICFVMAQTIELLFTHLFKKASGEIDIIKDGRINSAYDVFLRKKIENRRKKYKSQIEKILSAYVSLIRDLCLAKNKDKPEKQVIAYLIEEAVIQLTSATKAKDTLVERAVSFAELLYQQRVNLTEENQAIVDRFKRELPSFPRFADEGSVSNYKKAIPYKRLVEAESKSGKTYTKLTLPGLKKSVLTSFQRHSRKAMTHKIKNKHSGMKDLHHDGNLLQKLEFMLEKILKKIRRSDKAGIVRRPLFIEVQDQDQEQEGNVPATEILAAKRPVSTR